MINSPDHTNIQFTWQAILWRILLTGLLLLILAGSSLTIFDTAKTNPNTRILPTQIYETENR